MLKSEIQNPKSKIQNPKSKTQNDERLLMNRPSAKQGFRMRFRAVLEPMPTPIRAAGFTLIELSIAIVIIGLLVGGILVGRDLIEAAKIRSQLTQILDIELSVRTFDMKYNCLPGDCKNATQFFSASTQPEQVTNGDGDDKIEGLQYYYAPSDTHGRWRYDSIFETMRVFDHLAAAGLSELKQYDESGSNGVPGRNYPLAKWVSVQNLKANSNHWTNLHGGDIAGPFGVVLGYQTSSVQVPRSGHYLRLAMRRLQVSGQLFLGGEATYQPWDAEMLDKKFDDGMPYSGRMIITDDYGGYGQDTCATTAPPNYSGSYRKANNLWTSWGTGIQNACALQVYMGF